MNNNNDSLAQPENSPLSSEASTQLNVLFSLNSIKNYKKNLRSMEKLLPLKGITVHLTPDTLKTVWITQNQGAFLDKNIPTPCESLYTEDLYYCAAIAVNGLNKIGLLHVDHRSDFNWVRNFIADNFTATKNHPLIIHIAVRTEGYDKRLNDQGKYHKQDFSTQKKRINYLIYTIQEACAIKNLPIVLNCLYTGSIKQQSCSFLHTLGIHKDGSVYMCKSYEKYLTKEEKTLIRTSSEQWQKYNLMKSAQIKMNDYDFFDNRQISYLKRLHSRYPIYELDIINANTIEPINLENIVPEKKAPILPINRENMLYYSNIKKLIPRLLLGPNACLFINKVDDQKQENALINSNNNAFDLYKLMDASSSNKPDLVCEHQNHCEQTY